MIQVAKIVGTGLFIFGLIYYVPDLLTYALNLISFRLEYWYVFPSMPQEYLGSPLQFSFSMMGQFNEKKPYAIKGKGIYIITQDGRKILDGCSGAGVSSIGHGNKRVIDAITKQNKTGITYQSSIWDNKVIYNLCEELVKGTDNKMKRVYLINSGSEAIEVSVKLAYTYHSENNENKRINIVARVGSYHGATRFALSLSGYDARKQYYKKILNKKNIYYVSPCYIYRELLIGESNTAFVARKAAELEAKFLEIGPETVMCFILEPVVGAALGCVPFVSGYLKAMKEVCDKYGVLLIFDEIMCGMGRTGSLHTGQAEGVVPDIQVIAKGFGGGYVPISGVFASEKVVKVIMKGSGEFVHGQTYEAMPNIARGALEVQRVIQDNKLIENVAKQGAYLESRLKAILGNHPYVGDIRGRGLFWGIEFVENKETKKPFNPELGFAKKIVDLALSPEFNLAIYYGGAAGYHFHIDRIMIVPPFIIKKKEVDYIVGVISKVLQIVSKEVDTKRR